MQKLLQTVSIYWEASLFMSNNGVLTLFCFMKTMRAPDHQESDFQSSFYAFECKKDVPTNCLKLVTDKRQNQLSEPIVWPLRCSQKGQFSLTGRGDGIDGIKTPYNHVKTQISASKSIFHSFYAVLWSMDHTQKMTFQCI